MCLEVTVLKLTTLELFHGTMISQDGARRCPGGEWEMRSLGGFCQLARDKACLCSSPGAGTEGLRAGQLSAALLFLAFATERPVLVETSLGQASVGDGLLYLHTGLTCSPPWKFGRARPGVALHPLSLVHVACSLRIKNQTPASVHSTRVLNIYYMLWLGL